MFCFASQMFPRMRTTVCWRMNLLSRNVKPEWTWHVSAVHSGAVYLVQCKSSLQNNRNIPVFAWRCCAPLCKNITQSCWRHKVQTVMYLWGWLYSTLTFDFCITPQKLVKEQSWCLQSSSINLISAFFSFVFWMQMFYPINNGICQLQSN